MTDSVVVRWLTLGADGWRLDVVDELPDAFRAARLRERIRQVKPDAILIGEVWEDASNKIAYDVPPAVFYRPAAGFRHELPVAEGDPALCARGG